MHFLKHKSTLLSTYTLGNLCAARGRCRNERHIFKSSNLAAVMTCNPHLNWLWNMNVTQMPGAHSVARFAWLINSWRFDFECFEHPKTPRQYNTQSLAPQEGCHNECPPGLLGRKFIVVYYKVYFRWYLKRNLCYTLFWVDKYDRLEHLKPTWLVKFPETSRADLCSVTHILTAKPAVYRALLSVLRSTSPADLLVAK